MHQRVTWPSSFCRCHPIVNGGSLAAAVKLVVNGQSVGASKGLVRMSLFLLFAMMCIAAVEFPYVRDSQVSPPAIRCFEYCFPGWQVVKSHDLPLALIIAVRTRDQNAPRT